MNGHIPSGDALTAMLNREPWLLRCNKYMNTEMIEGLDRTAFLVRTAYREVVEKLFKREYPEDDESQCTLVSLVGGPGRNMATVNPIVGALNGWPQDHLIMASHSGDMEPFFYLLEDTYGFTQEHIEIGWTKWSARDGAREGVTMPNETQEFCVAARVLMEGWVHQVLAPHAESWKHFERYGFDASF